MVFKKKTAVYCQNHMEHTNALCRQNAEFKYDKAGGHNALKSLNPVPGGITGPPRSWGI
jgi:hypothetical protein